jgi:multidrug efflux system membrane fusion protein
MKASGRILGLVALLAAGVGAGVAADRWWHARSSGGDEKASADKPKPADEDEEPEPAAVVRTVIATSGELARTVDALGSAAIPPTATTIEAWPGDVLISRVLVQPGETVAKDAALLQVALTRDAETQFAAAQLSLETTSKALDAVKQRLDRALATRTDLLTAQAAHDEAEQKLERLQTGQPPKDGLLRAHAPGTVAAVRVQPGTTVTGGSPLIDIAADTVVAQIGLDPADVTGIAPGQAFDVLPLDERAPGRWKGRVSVLAHVVSPTTRLIDATLTLEGDAPPRPGTALRAHATLAGERGVLVPRAALVPDGDELVVFIVRDGTAVRSPVHVTLSGREQVVVTSGCSSGDHVIVSGQSQLTPGATVREITTGGTPRPRSGGDGADR